MKNSKNTKNMNNKKNENIVLSYGIVMEAIRNTEFKTAFDFYHSELDKMDTDWEAKYNVGFVCAKEQITEDGKNKSAEKLIKMTKEIYDAAFETQNPYLTAGIYSLVHNTCIEINQAANEFYTRNKAISKAIVDTYNKWITVTDEYFYDKLETSDFVMPGKGFMQMWHLLTD